MSGRADEFLGLLEVGDVDGLCAAWRTAMPGMPQPDSRDAAEVVMHMTRTASARVRFRLRAYSHAWLRERGYSSQLPEDLWPQAEREYPTVVEAVGIAVSFSTPHLKKAAEEIQKSMSYAVEDAFASGQTDSLFVRQRMLEARKRTERELFGR